MGSPSLMPRVGVSYSVQVPFTRTVAVLVVIQDMIRLMMFGGN